MFLSNSVELTHTRTYFCSREGVSGVLKASQTQCCHCWCWTLSSTQRPWCAHEAPPYAHPHAANPNGKRAPSSGWNGDWPGAVNAFPYNISLFVSYIPTMSLFNTSFELALPFSLPSNTSHLLALTMFPAQHVGPVAYNNCRLMWAWVLCGGLWRVARFFWCGVGRGSRLSSSGGIQRQASVGWPCGLSLSRPVLGLLVLVHELPSAPPDGDWVQKGLHL